MVCICKTSTVFPPCPHRHSHSHSDKKAQLVYKTTNYRGGCVQFEFQTYNMRILLVCLLVAGAVAWPQFVDDVTNALLGDASGIVRNIFLPWFLRFRNFQWCRSLFTIDLEWKPKVVRFEPVLLLS